MADKLPTDKMVEMKQFMVLEKFGKEEWIPIVRLAFQTKFEDLRNQKKNNSSLILIN